MDESLPKSSHNQRLIYILLFFCSLFLFRPSFAANSLSDAQIIPEKKKGTVVFNIGQKKDKLPYELHAEEVKTYRAQGFEAQKRGEYDAALGYYQKAIEMDPNYAIAYNDLGVLYEAMGETGRAEINYVKAMQLDGRYLSPYSNLALLYENKRDFKNAAYYWQKRSELGSPDDPWTSKARERYYSICLTLGITDVAGQSREQEVVGLANEVSKQKSYLQRDDKELASYYFGQAKSSSYRGDDVTALKSAITANQLDPGNDKINEYIEKLQKRLLTR